MQKWDLQSFAGNTKDRGSIQHITDLAPNSKIEMPELTLVCQSTTH